MELVRELVILGENEIETCKQSRKTNKSLDWRLSLVWHKCLSQLSIHNTREIQPLKCNLKSKSM